MGVFFVKFIEPDISDLHFIICNHNLRGKPQEIRLGRKKYPSYLITSVYSVFFVSC